MSNEVMSPISPSNSPREKTASSRKIGDNVSFLDHNNVEIEDEGGDVASPRDSSTKSTARKEEEILMKSEIRYDMCFMFPTDPTTGAFSERSEDVMRKILPNIGKDNVHIYYRYYCQQTKNHLYCYYAVNNDLCITIFLLHIVSCEIPQKQYINIKIYYYTYPC